MIEALKLKDDKILLGKVARIGGGLGATEAVASGMPGGGVKEELDLAAALLQLQQVSLSGSLSGSLSLSLARSLYLAPSVSLAFSLYGGAWVVCVCGQ